MNKTDSVPDTYQITLSVDQARAVQHALEAVSRMGIGQVEDALTYFPTKEYKPDGWHEAMTQVKIIMEPFRKESRLRCKRSDQLWAIMSTIRHRLAWDRAIDDGVIKEGEARKWPEMMTVDYDEPFSVFGEPAIKVERVKND